MKYLTIFVFFMMTSFGYAADIPDPNLTPGLAMDNTSVETLCLSGYTGTVRHVTEAMKRTVFERYNVDPKADKWEIDHFLPLEIFGKNSIENLWPQSYTTTWNAHKKDRLENAVHRKVCDGILTLEQGQAVFLKNDWRKMYCQYFDDMKDECDKLENK